MSASTPGDDSNIAARLRSGDERAFEELFRAHHPSLCAFALRLTGSREVAEELVQSVFLDLWIKRQQLVVQTSIRALLFRSVRNRAIDSARHLDVEHRWAAEVEAGGDETERPAGVQQRLESEEREQALRAAVEKLPSRARLVVALRWQQGMRPTEIAEVLGISVKGVEIQITRALRALRELLSDDVQ